jgi:hypothetical protein
MEWTLAHFHKAAGRVHVGAGRRSWRPGPKWRQKHGPRSRSDVAPRASERSG